MSDSQPFLESRRKKMFYIEIPSCFRRDANLRYFTTDVTLSKEEEKEMKGLFLSSDVNQDGFITAAEFLYSVTRNGAKVTEDDVKNAIQVADLDGDGQLSYDEFVKYKMAR